MIELNRAGLNDSKVSRTHIQHSIKAEMPWKPHFWKDVQRLSNIGANTCQKDRHLSIGVSVLVDFASLRQRQTRGPFQTLLPNTQASSKPLHEPSIF